MELLNMDIKDTYKKRQRTKTEIRDRAKFNSLVVDLHDMHTCGLRDTCKIIDEN